MACITTTRCRLNELRDGDLITALDDRSLPFPFVVAQVVNTHTARGVLTMVRYRHGGITLPRDSATPVDVVVMESTLNLTDTEITAFAHGLTTWPPPPGC